jgi:SAM-dependent methyltransferase/uncharacterized protein YbaR (Trm112 family)
MIDPWFEQNLACPVDHAPIRADGDALACAHGHRYPVVDGVPVMLRADVSQTIGLADASLKRAAGQEHDPRAPELHLESLGISDEEKVELLQLARTRGPIDPVVAYLIAATNGLMYRHLIGTLDRYPIPDMPLPDGRGRRLLDVGCSWGRWSLAAARLGYDTVGIDPSLGAVMAARRVARQLGASTRYVVGDARHLPFAAATFDVVYSYSVLQHLSERDAEQAVAEIGRLLRRGGAAKVQMPTRFGIRCLYHQARRGFREARDFEVRYRTLPELRRLFGTHVGPVRFDADCYFGIGLQASDAHLMTAGLRTITQASERLKRISRRMPALTRIADSVFVEALKQA